MRALVLLATLFAWQPVAAEDCVVPTAPPCLPFDDPRWSNPNCKVPKGACFYVLTETVGGKKISRVNLVISPRCGESGSESSLERAAMALLAELQDKKALVFKEVAECSKEGFVDIKITTEG